MGCTTCHIACPSHSWYTSSDRACVPLQQVLTADLDTKDQQLTGANKAGANSLADIAQSSTASSRKLSQHLTGTQAAAEQAQADTQQVLEQEEVSAHVQSYTQRTAALLAKLHGKVIVIALICWICCECGWLTVISVVSDVPRDLRCCASVSRHLSLCALYHSRA